MTDNMKLNAYLSGAMEHAPDEGAAWRSRASELVHSELGHSVYNPNDEIHNILSKEEQANFRKWKVAGDPKFDVLINRIMDNDIDVLLNKTDYVICYWDEYVKFGAGTQGELTLAYEHKIPVYLFTSIPVENISSWILGCVDEVYADLDSLISDLKKKSGNGNITKKHN